ncbi:putative 5-oxoprolinase (ATP-hydrolyzing) [Crocosphaera subtropica ATCC 51142]|uniref:5-oxoprolinase (ATP-hydrolyzing) n=1 Tax=Crocosphaera subtropica (strain ATCC 51142 / BH68) TaxID=43989 RepID=B1X1J6_CROS5|nr:hydantoinase/oxoprolinase family protein [Crocosphaera subtropica]ACB51425.1 putative 5-oxoprolinase (ATP-hydrolyzing) [Crocosphaera subtropica ATCC 51142]
MLKFFVDRGGTFTDIVAVINDSSLIEQLSQKSEPFLMASLPHHTWIVVYKLLSENPERYQDAVIQGIRDILCLDDHQPIPTETIEVVKMGTTVATNALLERKGDRTVLLITKGFKDALKIGYQNRPNIFARHIVLPSMLYESVIEVEERYDRDGKELIPVNLEKVRDNLKEIYDQGIRSCAIVFMHSYRYPNHENQVAEIAKKMGFTQISISHQVSPLMKLVSRGDTTVVDAYLSPILRRYVDQVSSQLPNTKLMFMKSDGGLIDAHKFQGKDSILSGPAGGIVGAVQTSLRAGFQGIITFDMGGTSTDVAHFKGEYERQLDNEIAGARMRVPVLSIHTVAAGGGSILYFDGASFKVGPDSAGANPGPACYRRGGPLTVTDANVMLGKIQPHYFPHIFGKEGNLPLDKEIVNNKFLDLSQEIYQSTNHQNSPENIAAGFIKIAVENMANAIKKISLQRGYDVTHYTLCTFGGAGGQVACLIADTLGIKTIFLHPYAGGLSAYGMGLADIRVIKESSLEKPLNEDIISELKPMINELENQARNELDEHESIKGETIVPKVSLKYQGTDSTLLVDFSDNITLMQKSFEDEHQLRYGFIQPQKMLIVESISVEIIQIMDSPDEPLITRIRPLDELPKPLEIVNVFTDNQWQDTPIFQREDLQPQDNIKGPAIIIEKISTIMIEPHWTARLTEYNHLILERDYNY